MFATLRVARASQRERTGMPPKTALASHASLASLLTLIRRQEGDREAGKAENKRV
jgi:hypothetical protein